MESYKPNFKSLESVAPQLENEVEYFKTSTDYFHNFARTLRDNEDFDKNFDQLNLVSRAFVSDITVEDEASMKAFLIGGLFGYNSLARLPISDLYDETYTAINAYIADARIKVKNQLEFEDTEVSESYRNFMISEILNDTLAEDLSFNSVDKSEVKHVHSMVHHMMSNETHTTFSMKGYSFIRGVLIWYERHKIEIIKKYLRSVNETDDANERNFFEIISSIEINPDLADGKIDCDKELHILNTYFKKINSKYKPDKDMDDDLLDEILQEMEMDIMRLFYTFENLVMFGRFTFEGPNAVLIADDRLEFTRFFAFGEDSILEGNIVDVEVRAIPNQNTINKITQAHREGVDTGMQVKLSNYGLVLKIQDAVIIADDGSVTTFPKHANVFVAMGMKKNRILQHLYDYDGDYYQDSGENDNFENDGD